MRLAQIEYFLEVAEQLNFTAAAKSLYISQPALSKQISLLEEELGAKLFVRSTRHVTLTAAGRQLEMDLKALREQLEDAVKRAAQIGNSEQLTLRIGCFDGAVTDDFLPAVYQHISKAAPTVQISLFRGNFAENRKSLEKGGIDLLLTLDLDDAPWESLESCVISRRQGALVYSDKSPLAKIGHPEPPDFSRETFLVMNRKLSPGLYQSGIENLKALNIAPARIEEIVNASTLFTRLELGHGFTLLTEEVTAKNPHLRHTVPPGLPGINVIAVWKKSNQLAEALMKSYPAARRL